MPAGSLACVPLSVTPWTVALQAPLSIGMGFPRQEYRSGLPFPSPWRWIMGCLALHEVSGGLGVVWCPVFWAWSVGP